MNSQYRKNLKAVMQAGKNYTDQQNAYQDTELLFELAGKTPSVVDDNTIAYQKVVPTGATKVKLKSIGGMSYKCNNLFDNENTTLVNSTFNASNQTLFSYAGFALKVFNLTIGQTYTITSTKTMLLGETNDLTNSGTVSNGTSYTFTATTTYLLITNYVANEYDDMFANIMLNVGGTALPYEPYFAGIRDSAVTSVVSYGANKKDLSYSAVNYYRNNNTTFISTTDTSTTRIRTESVEFEMVANKTYYINNIPSGITLIGVAGFSEYGGTAISNAITSSTNSFTTTRTDIKYIFFLYGGSNFDATTKTLFNQIGIFESNIYKPYRGVIDTYTVPDQVKALSGYGWGVNSNCYNALDLETKSYTQKVASYTFTGNEAIAEYTRSSDGNKTYAIAINSRAKTTNVLFESLSLSTATSMNDMEDNSYRGATDTTSVIFYSTSYQTSASMLAFLTGKTIYFELATYNITSNLELPDNVIDVEEGGTLTFTNTYGQAVPSSVTYLTGLDNLDDLYVKKVTTTSTVMQAYVKLDNGTNQMLDVHWNNYRDTIPIRDQTGNIRVATTPTNDAHATSKKYINDNYQPKLVSGTNIKTINNQSLLGSGNIDIQGGGGTTYKHFIHLTFLDGCAGEYDIDGWVILENTSNTQFTATTFKALFDSPNLFEDMDDKIMTTMSNQCVKVGWDSLMACCYRYNSTSDYFNCEAFYSGELTLATITDTVTTV